MVGGTEEPNLEKIASLRPDLILSNPWQEDIHGQLSAIAPTVAVPLSYSDYEAEFRYVADLLGRSGQAERLLADHAQRLQAFRTAMGPRLADLEVSVVRVFPDRIRIEANSYVPTLLARAGVRRPAAQQNLAETKNLSLEQIEEADGDVLIVYSAANAETEAENARARGALQQHPLWRQLDAVKTGRVHFVDSFLWAGGGVLWADRVLDELSSYLLPARQ